MAQLVLGTAGAVVGSFFGPLGASIGWAAGGLLANVLFPQKVEGPRLTDLKLQGSQYGQMIPIAMGTVRIAGNLIWQTDLEEHSETSDGKGGPEVTTYSYTASFAIQLCEGPIVAVTRIWADSRLIHDTRDYTSQQNLGDSILTTYLGTEDQLPDPTMEAVLGAGEVPAYRGTAYCVFTDLPLGDYGNRLPNFTFEVVTVGPANEQAHLAARETLPHYWQCAGAPDPVIGIPYIHEWTPGGEIVIKNMTPAEPSHRYDADTLAHLGEQAYLGAGTLPRNVPVIGPPPSIVWDYFSVGQTYLDGALVHVRFEPFYTTAAGTTNTALAGGNVWSTDGVNTEADLELAVSAGIPPSVHICSVAFTQDNVAMFVLTAASAGGNATNWYKIIDGAIADSGTVATLGGYLLGFGSWDSASGVAGAFRACMAENNQRYIWRVSDAPDPRRFSVFWIDDDGVLDVHPVVLTVDIDDFEPGVINASPSCRVFREGYCGAVFANDIAVATRFPLVAPSGPTYEVAVTTLCERAGLDASQVVATTLADDILDGYVIGQQGQVRAALGQLQSAALFDAVESDNTVKFVKRGAASAATIDSDELACHVYGATELPPRLTTTRIQEIELPRVFNVNYLDAEIDYQQGTQSARREVTLSELESTISLAIVMSGAKARAVADINLYNAWKERERFSLALSRRYAHLEPTDVITAEGRVMRITRKEESAAGVIQLEAVATDTRMWISGPAPAPTSGGFTPTPSGGEQDTDLVMLDLPPLREADQATGYYTAMNGRDSPRWRGAGLFRSTDGGVNYSSLGTNGTVSIIGNTTTTLGDFTGGNVFDESNNVTVFLTAGSAALASATELAVLNGTNEALVGSEIIRFKTATLIAPRTYRLSGLLRGRRGTEWAMASHTATEVFVMLWAVQDHAMSAADLGLVRHFKAPTIGQALADADEVVFVAPGRRNKPFAPVHVGGGRNGAGDVAIHWTRRTRLGGAWRPGGDALLGESSESYVLEIWDSTYSNCARVITGITSPTYVYTSAMQVADFGAQQLTIFARVGQLGAYSLGYQTDASIPGAGASNDAVLVPVDPYAGPPPTSGGTVDENHYANFRALFYNDFAQGDGVRERQLAYKYTQLGPVAGWYADYETTIIANEFGGNSYARALWVQDADLSPPLDTDVTAPRYPDEFNDLIAMAVAAGS